MHLRNSVVFDGYARFKVVLDILLEKESLGQLTVTTHPRAWTPDPVVPSPILVMEECGECSGWVQEIPRVPPL